MLKKINNISYDLYLRYHIKDIVKYYHKQENETKHHNYHKNMIIF